MADETPALPYEVLFRFGVDGAVSGAHYIAWEQITRNGQPASPEPGKAKGLAILDGEDRSALDALLGASLAAALTHNDTLSADVETANVAVETANQAAAESASKMAAAEALAATYSAALTQRSRQLQEVAADRDQKTIQITVLQQTVADLRAQLSGPPVLTPDEPAVAEA